MLRAVIFDFNGVLVDDEPIHLKMIQKVLRDEGHSLDDDDYYANYLGFDDRDCFRNFYQNHKLPIEDRALEELVARKGRYYREGIEEHITVFPGVKKLVSDLAKRHHLGIASGALRREIDLILTRIGFKNHFQVIVSTEDVSKGKPNPESYVTALKLLNQKAGGSAIQPSECLVIEDSKEGIRAARAANMVCLAVANSHAATELTEANAVVQSLEEVTPQFLEKLFPSRK